MVIEWASLHSEEYTYSTPPARLYKASILDSQNLFPKLIPHAFKSNDVVQGNGRAGSINRSMLQKVKNFNHLKYQIDELNEETYTYNYILIEAYALYDKLEKITYQVKLEGFTNGGTIAKMTSSYYSPGYHTNNEDKVKAGKEKASATYKAVKADIAQNADAFA